MSVVSSHPALAKKVNKCSSQNVKLFLLLLLNITKDEMLHMTILNF